jgi:hypothetical protein
MLALLAACGPGENEPGPGGVTAGEAKALDEAAAMLDERKLPPEALATEPAGETGAQAPAAPENERNKPDGR